MTNAMIPIGTPIDPSSQFETITPSNDSPEVTYNGKLGVTKGVSLPNDGILNCENEAGVAQLIPLVGGVIHPIKTRKIFATGTPATVTVYF